MKVLSGRSSNPKSGDFVFLILFDMGFFEPSVMGGGGHEGPPS